MDLVDKLSELGLEVIFCTDGIHIMVEKDNVWYVYNKDKSDWERNKIDGSICTANTVYMQVVGANGFVGVMSETSLIRDYRSTDVINISILDTREENPYSITAEY